MKREHELRLQEGLREADGNVGHAARIALLLAAVDACRACPSRAQRSACADCVLQGA
jgi:hypothetical protein